MPVISTNVNSAAPLSLPGRFLVILGLTSCVFLAAGAAHYFLEAHANRTKLESSENLNVEIGRTALSAHLEGPVSDLNFLATYNARLGLFDEFDESSRAMLSSQLLAYSEQHDVYDQIRLMDLAGREIVRVNHDGGDVRVVADAELQTKSGRYYFLDSVSLNPGQVYISPLDLNVEHGVVEQPYKPVLRLATPVADSTGRKRGVLVLNYKGELLLEDFRQAVGNVGDHASLLNVDGYWLSSPTRDDEWGFMFDREHTFATSYPLAWERIKAHDAGQFLNAEGMFSFATVYPMLTAIGDTDTASSSAWKIVSHLPAYGLSPLVFLHRHLLWYSVVLLLLIAGSAAIAYTSLKHKAAEALAAFERRFRYTLDNVNIAALCLDPEGTVTYCNGALSQLIEWEREDLIGRNWFDTAVPAANREGYRDAFRQILSRPTAPSRHEGEIVSRSGTRRLISWNDSVVLKASGSIVGLTCLGQDVTEARAAENQVLVLSRAVEQSPSVVMLVNLDGNIEYVNPKFTAITGYSLDEVRGRNPRILKSGTTEDSSYEAMWKTITAGGEWRGVFQNCKKSGELYWESASISCVRDAHGKIAHYLAVKEDITEQVNLQKRLQLVIESAPFAIAMTDDDGKLVLVNSRTEDYFGYSREELLGQPVEILVPARMRKSHAALRRSYVYEPQARDMGIGRDLFGRRKDGSEFPIEVGLNAIETDADESVLIAIADISQRKRLEKELERRNREFVNSQALAAVGRMANMVAHDLRNPLSSVKMGLQILARKGHRELSEDEIEIRQIALDQVRYMEDILQDLLSYSRPASLHPEWLSIQKVLTRSLAAAQRHTEANKVEITTWYQSGLPTVHADEDKLRRIFSNLITNAIQATADCEATAEVSVNVRLDLEKTAPRIRIEIRDNGRGIDPDQLERLFEPFYTTHTQGTGLGLPIVKRFLDQHGATIDLLPAEGSGTVAVVLLQLDPIVVPEEQLMATNLQIVTGNRESLLVEIDE